MTNILTSQRTQITTIILLSMGLILSIVSGIVLAQALVLDSPADGSTFNATQYERFLQEIVMDGGVPPYTFVATGLPSGFEIEENDDGNGEIFGATSETGTFPIEVTATDSEPGTPSSIMFNYTIEVAATTNAIEIDTPDVYKLTEGTVNVLYTTIQFSTTDDAIEDTYEWDADNLPNGMAIDTGTGQLIGTPTQSGTFNITIKVEDPNANQRDGERDYQLVINGPTGGNNLQISSPTSSNLPDGVLGNSYSVDVDATGGDGNYTFFATGLPGGLGINNGNGRITGTPTSTGDFDVTVRVEDGNGASAERDYTLRINETGDVVYESNPDPNQTIDFGNVNIGASFTRNLDVSEGGSDTLEVDPPNGGMIIGTDAGQFSITSNAPPFDIDDGDDDVRVRIACSPTSEGTKNALLQFETNDEDNELVVYTLRCTGVLTGGSADDGSQGGTGDGSGIIDGPTPFPTQIILPTLTPLPPTYSNVIEVEGLSLRSGPFIGASRLGVLRRDTNYRVTAKNNQEGVYMWYYIVRDDGREGWASGRYLAVYGVDVPFMGSTMDNVWGERDRGVRVKALDNLNFRPGPSERTLQYPDLIPWGGIMTVYARTVSGRGNEWYAVDYNGIKGWVYAPATEIVEGIIDAIAIY